MRSKGQPVYGKAYDILRMLLVTRVDIWANIHGGLHWPLLFIATLHRTELVKAGITLIKLLHLPRHSCPLLPWISVSN